MLPFIFVDFRGTGNHLLSRRVDTAIVPEKGADRISSLLNPARFCRTPRGKIHLDHAKRGLVRPGLGTRGIKDDAGNQYAEKQNHQNVGNPAKPAAALQIVSWNGGPAKT